MSDCCQFLWSSLTEFIKLLSHIYEMRLSWFAPPVVFFFFRPLLVAARIFTIRPKPDLATAKQTCRLANLGATTTITCPQFRGRACTTDARPINHAAENPLPPPSRRASEIPTLQTENDMEESLSQYFGRPTESTSVQINMQRRRSSAPIGPSPPDEIAKRLRFRCNNPYLPANS